MSRKPADTELRHNKMKRLFGIIELSANEQRVVLIIIFILIIIAVFAYERRVHDAPVKSVFATQLQPSPTAVQTVGDQ